VHWYLRFINSRLNIWPWNFWVATRHTTYPGLHSIRSQSLYLLFNTHHPLSLSLPVPLPLFPFSPLDYPWRYQLPFLLFIFDLFPWFLPLFSHRANLLSPPSDHSLISTLPFPSLRVWRNQHPNSKRGSPPPRLSGGDATYHHRSLSAHFLHSPHYPPGRAGPSLHSLGALIPYSPLMCGLALKIGNIHPFLFQPCGPCAGRAVQPINYCLCDFACLFPSS
jgi:hypothetical protein